MREVNDPGIGLLVDIYHMLMEGEGPESIRAFGDLIMHAHIAEKEGRSPPGTYNEDFTAYIHALKRISYEGGMSLECEWKNLEAQAGPAYQAIQQQIESAP